LKVENGTIVNVGEAAIREAVNEGDIGVRIVNDPVSYSL
jgi:hypothetical protein